MDRHRFDDDPDPDQDLDQNRNSNPGSGSDPQHCFNDCLASPTLAQCPDTYGGSVLYGMYGTGTLRDL